MRAAALRAPAPPRPRAPAPACPSGGCPPRLGRGPGPKGVAAWAGRPGPPVRLLHVRMRRHFPAARWEGFRESIRNCSPDPGHGAGAAQGRQAGRSVGGGMTLLGGERRVAGGLRWAEVQGEALLRLCDYPEGQETHKLFEKVCLVATKSDVISVVSKSQNAVQNPIDIHFS